MKYAGYGTAVALGCMFVLTMPLIGQSGMIGQGPMEPPGATRESPARGPSGMMGSGTMGMMESGGMGGHMGMMGEGGMGRMEMMGPQMRSGMAGGGTGGQPQSAQGGTGTPQPLTQEDTQGGVTVSATLLTPDKPRPDGTLAVQVTLDTHAVDLDPYALETLAVLRDGQGCEVPALRLESPGGSGHHREGVLSFPATDAGGTLLVSPEAKAVTLIVRGIGGVPERVFQWPLGAGSRR
jgi:hypothetical protein